MKGNGNVGIGINPAYLLDVNGRMRIRSGGSQSNSAGVWLNNFTNEEAAVVGMKTIRMLDSWETMVRLEIFNEHHHRRIEN
jgi:hypothetical protein